MQFINRKIRLWRHGLAPLESLHGAGSDVVHAAQSISSYGRTLVGRNKMAVYPKK